ncbi:Saccharopine dehydrogenase-domain-containing protein [Lophiotrema nucula]|uniref:Saccharopine dehydrogenase-domain-containing protein n=1 Tax=Lophiotrema nucula TaxID=690887 RepID=A0A6A5YQD0_9PLEO|nr:Saccharopine dehydrogenase-domain-containing protein [Lophiotrema nucula]
MISDPEFDILVLGATGYTGRICVEHLASNFPTNLKWAIAGRSASSLENLKDKLQSIDPDRSPPATIITQLEHDALHELVRRTRVVINGVGPYHRYSEVVVEACASAGTHYVDFSTETPWIAEMVHRYHDTAEESGAVIIHAASNSSSPPDLLAWLIASKIFQVSGKRTKAIVASGKLEMAGMQGGSAMTVLDSAQHYGVGWLLHPNNYCTVPNGIPRTQRSNYLGYTKDQNLGILTTSLVGVSNSAIVQRSAYLQPDLYSKDFVYSEYQPAPNKIAAIVTHLFMKFAILLLALPPIRALIRKLSYKPGTGPDWRQSAKTESVLIKAVGTGEDGTQVRGHFEWKGAIVHISAIAAAEAAGVLVHKAKNGDLVGKGGTLTPSFLGEELVERLKKQGCVFEVQAL